MQSWQQQLKDSSHGQAGRGRLSSLRHGSRKTYDSSGKYSGRLGAERDANLELQLDEALVQLEEEVRPADKLSEATGLWP